MNSFVVVSVFFLFLTSNQFQLRGQNHFRMGSHSTAGQKPIPRRDTPVMKFQLALRVISMLSTIFPL